MRDCRGGVLGNGERKGEKGKERKMIKEIVAFKADGEDKTRNLVRV